MRWRFYFSHSGEMKMVQMTAVGGPEVLKLVEVEEPRPSPGEIRVANQAIAINSGGAQTTNVDKFRF